MQNNAINKRKTKRRDKDMKQQNLETVYAISLQKDMIKKDKSIQIIRIMSMISIVLCHIMEELNSELLNMFSQFLSIGVYIFLFISGYLYGKKYITDIKQFYKGRILKILLPMYIFIIALYIITLFTNNKINQRAKFG